MHFQSSSLKGERGWPTYVGLCTHMEHPEEAFDTALVLAPLYEVKQWEQKSLTHSLNMTLK